MTQTYAERLFDDPDFVAELEAAEKRTHRYIVIWWAMRILIVALLLATWALMVYAVNTLNDVQDQLRRDTRIVIDAPVEIEEDFDA